MNTCVHIVKTTLLIWVIQELFLALRLSREEERARHQVCLGVFELKV